MDPFWKTIISQQFGAAIDMLENAIRACPDDVWADRSQPPRWPTNDVPGFWYVAFHALFWLDCYLSNSLEDFRPPPPFNRDEFDPAGLLPEKPYSKDELLDYLEHGRNKCHAAIKSLNEQTVQQPSATRPPMSNGELLLYNMRHVQHHAAQLNLILRQKTASAPAWVSKEKT